MADHEICFQILKKFRNIFKGYSTIMDKFSGLTLPELHVYTHWAGTILIKIVEQNIVIDTKIDTKYDKKLKLIKLANPNAFEKMQEWVLKLEQIALKKNIDKSCGRNDHKFYEYQYELSKIEEKLQQI